MALFISLTNYAVVFYRICNDIPRPPRVYCTVTSGVIPGVGKSSMSTRRIILESVPACQISPAHQGSALSLFLQLMWLFSKLRDTVYNELALANYYPHRQLCRSLLPVLVTISNNCVTNTSYYITYYAHFFSICTYWFDSNVSVTWPMPKDQGIQKFISVQNSRMFMATSYKLPGTETVNRLQ